MNYKMKNNFFLALFIVSVKYTNNMMLSHIYVMGRLRIFAHLLN